MLNQSCQKRLNLKCIGRDFKIQKMFVFQVKEKAIFNHKLLSFVDYDRRSIQRNSRDQEKVTLSRELR
jgi:hypothetical protein